MGLHSVVLSTAGNGGSSIETPARLVTDARLQAVARAARFYGTELDPAEFPWSRGEAAPSAESLAAWAHESGLWSRARHRMQPAG